MRQTDFHLKLVEAPTVEPVSADEAKLYARIDHDTEDTIIANWIKTARAEAEKYQRRAFTTQTWEMTYDTFPITPIEITRAPLISVLTIKYFDFENTETTLYNSLVPVGTESNYIVDTDSTPGRIALAFGVSWPTTTLRSINAVKIRYTAGYGAAATDVPAEVKDAIYIYCAWRNENRTAESGEMPEQFYNVLRPSRLRTGNATT